VVCTFRNDNSFRLLGTNTISLSFGNSFNSGTLSVRAVNGCGQSSTSCLTLGRNVPAIPASISGPTSNLCGGGSFNYSVSAVAGATSYIWTVPSGCSITANNGTNITVSFPSNFSSGSITVKAANSCGTGTARSLSLSRLPSTPSTISGPTTVCINQQQRVVYTTPVVQGLNLHVDSSKWCDNHQRTRHSIHYSEVWNQQRKCKSESCEQLRNIKLTH
jgi:large repetitive protein